MSNLKNVAEMIGMIQEFHPIVSRVLKDLEVYKDEWQIVCDFIVTDTVNVKSRIYKGFIEKNIPAEHALALTINTVDNLSKAIKAKVIK